MGFASEEDVDAWYLGEKEKLDTRFATEIEGNKEGMADYRVKYEKDFKRLIQKYQAECSKFIK